MRRIAWMLAATLALWMTGCGLGAMAYRAPVEPPKGAIVTVYKAPLTIDLKETRVCRKMGYASSYYIRDIFITGLGFAWGEADLNAAAQQGNLKRVEYADYELVQVLSIFGKFTVVAWGE